MNRLSKDNTDKVLHLQHNPVERSLDWQFLGLDSLSEATLKEIQ